MSTSKLPFFTAYSRPEAVASVSGTKEIFDYHLKIIDGHEVVIPKYTVKEKTGEKVYIMRDIYEIKQEALEGSYLPRMIERFLNGSLSPEQFDTFKNPQSWTDVDVTRAPSSLAEAMQLQIDAENAFNSLDPKLRDLFGNNKYKFVEAMQDGSALKRLEAAGFIQRNSAQVQSQLEAKKEEIKKEEVK